MNDDLVKRLRDQQTKWMTPLLGQAADRIEELEAKLSKKDGCLEETYRRWKNGADLRALAKAEGCTQERMRHKMKRYEEDKVRLLEAERDEALNQLDSANHSLEVLEKRVRTFVDGRTKAEAKLAKSVERLEKLSRWLDLDDEELANLPIETLAEDHRHIQQQVNATLAELKDINNDQ